MNLRNYKGDVLMENKKLLALIIILSMIIFSFGFFTGNIFTHGQYMGMLDKISTGFENAIQIENIEIDFNETQIIEALTKNMNQMEKESFNAPLRLIK